MTAGAVNLFEHCTRLEALDRAWAKVRANGGCAGGDGVPIPRFQAQAARRLILLSRAIRSGRYRPAPIRLIGIPKPNGDLRRLAIPSIIDRVAQTAVADVLTPIMDLQFADESFAYRPGRSVQQAVRRVADLRAKGFDWVVDGDIERYFDSVPHPPLIDKLEMALDGHSGVTDLLDLISRWLAAAAAVEGGGGAVRVSPEGRTAIVHGYQRWVARPVKSTENGKRVTWRRLMEEQVNAYARHVRHRDGEPASAFRPYRMDY